MRLTPRQYVTIEEAAERLGVSESTLRAWVEDGSLPAHRFGDRYGIAIEALRQWHSDLLEKMRAALHTPIPDLRTITLRECVVEIRSKDYGDTILSLLNCMKAAGCVDRTECIASALLDHVAQYPVAPGQGIAFPHIRHPDVVRTSIAGGLATTPIPGSLDLGGESSRVVILLLAHPSERSGFIGLLNAFAHAFADESYRRQLASTQTTDDLYRLLTDSTHKKAMDIGSDGHQFVRTRHMHNHHNQEKRCNEG